MAALRGRRVLLTGASRGIGRHSLDALLGAGATVMGVARSESALRAVIEELSPERAQRFLPVAADLVHEDSFDRIAERVGEQWGALDVLVNNAGVMLHHDDEIASEPAGVLEETFEVNLFAPHRLTRSLLPLLLAGSEPRVVNVSSDAGTHAGMTEPGISGYRLSKWALNGLTMLQAKELEGRVSVLALDPGWVRTDLGGPDAPGDPRDSAKGLLAVLDQEASVTGLLFRDGRVAQW